MGFQIAALDQESVAGDHNQSFSSGVLRVHGNYRFEEDGQRLGICEVLLLETQKFGLK